MSTATIQAEDNGPPMSSIKAVDIAAMKLIKESFQDAENKTVIASSLGVATLLSMYSAGTQGQSRNEIMKLLGFTDFEQFQEFYINLVERVSSINPKSLLLANKIFMSDNFTLDDNFSNVVRSHKSEVELVEFAQKGNATDRINQWVSEKTTGLMSSFGNVEIVDDDTVLALFNIIYFKGKLKYQFDFSEAEKGEFYVDKSTTVKKPMMKLTTCLSYGKNSRIGASMVELPYSKEGTRMVIVLPDKKDGLPQILNKLAERGLLESFQSSRPSRKDVYLEMPTIEVTSILDLKKILPKIGVSSIFKEGAAGLAIRHELIVSKAFQEVYVKVDEKGAMVADSTGCASNSGLKKPNPPIQFKVDRPFLYAILRDNTVNFVGTYAR